MGQCVAFSFAPDSFREHQQSDAVRDRAQAAQYILVARVLVDPVDDRGVHLDVVEA